MKNLRLLPIAVVVAAVFSGCSSMPAADSMLMQARNDYSAAQSNPQVASLAPVELRQASDSLDRANAASSKGEKDAVVDHLAYVAKQQVQIARETAGQKAAELAVTNSAAERDRVRLDARTREADAAQRNAAASQRQSEASLRQSEASLRQSEASQRQSDASRREAEAAQRSSEASRLTSESAQRDAALSQRDAATAQRQAEVERLAAANAQASAQSAQASAESARQQALDAEGRARSLEAQLKDLEAKKTPRGLVITLGDVLFDTNQAQLKSGGLRSVQKLADFFKQYPQRTVMIEGFTDSTGGTSRNQILSDDRAYSVRTALLGMGVGTERITSKGYGESYPVANNDTAAGRQMNRRVELIVSDESGRIAPR